MWMTLHVVCTMLIAGDNVLSVVLVVLIADIVLTPLDVMFAVLVADIVVVQLSSAACICTIVFESKYLKMMKYLCT